ncbi:MAG: nuclear transport factor 2 family protein [Bryobacteraceae bacterium]
MTRKYALLALLTLSASLFAQTPKPRKATRAKSAQGQARRAMEQRVKALEDKDAILKVMYGYAYTVDFGKETHEYTDLYTEDATFLSVPSPAPGSPVPATLEERAAQRPATGAFTGRKALEGWIVNEWKMRDDLLAKGHYRIHELISPDVTITGDTASTRSFFQTTDNDNGRIYAVSIGVYKGQMVRGADGKWRIKEWLLIRQGPGNPTGAR